MTKEEQQKRDEYVKKHPWRGTPYRPGGWPPGCP